MNSGGSFSAQKGLMTYWALGQETDPDKLRSGLEALGYDNLNLQQRTWTASLKTALTRLDIPKTLVRGLKAKAKDGYIIVKEDKGSDDNEYDSLVHAKVDDQGTVTVERGAINSWQPNGYVRQDDLQEKVNHFHRVLPGGSVAQVLVTLVEKIGGLCIKPQGGLYFVPDQRISDWMDIVRVVESAACEDSVNEVSYVVFQLNRTTLRDIRREITAEVTAAAEEIRQELADNDYGEEALIRRAYRANALRQRTEEYEAILGGTLDVCHEALAEAARAFSVADAAQEGTFAGMF